MVNVSNAAEEKLAGKIRTIINVDGNNIGINPFEKSSNSSCFSFSKRATYATRTILAISEVWKLKFINGIFNQREALFRFTPIKRVKINSTTVGQKSR